jgi:hypothetical protein
MSVACVMRPDSSSSLGMYTIVPAGQQRRIGITQQKHHISPQTRRQVLLHLARLLGAVQGCHSLPMLS